MANHEDLHITLTLLIGVAVACGVLYWSGKNAAPAPIPSTSPATPLPPAPVAPLIPTPMVAGPADRASVPPVPGNRAQETPSDNYDGPDLPIVFAFSERATYTAEENDEGKLVNVSRQVKEGIISNSSGEPLTITATEVNIATQETSQTQFVLGAGTQKHFGSNQGLKMLSGDQLTLRSPSYKDFSQQIP